MATNKFDTIPAEQHATPEGQKQALELLRQHIDILCDCLRNPTNISTLVFLVAKKDDDTCAAGIFGTGGDTLIAIKTLLQKRLEMALPKEE